ncbi:MAG: hypothetical protein ACREQ2_12240 [Candidatus Binatia bacterium]
MSEDIALTVLILLIIVAVSWLGTTILTKFKRRRKKHLAERGVVNYLRNTRR